MTSLRTGGDWGREEPRRSVFSRGVPLQILVAAIFHLYGLGRDLVGIPGMVAFLLAQGKRIYAPCDRRGGRPALRSRIRRHSGRRLHFRTARRKPRLVLASVLLGNALFMLLTATAANATTAVVFLTATGFFLPAIHGPFWSLVMDLLPSRVIGSSSGFLNTGGQIAGITSPIIIGALIQLTGHYEAGLHVHGSLGGCVGAVGRRLEGIKSKGGRRQLWW